MNLAPPLASLSLRLSLRLALAQGSGAYDRVFPYPRRSSFFFRSTLRSRPFKVLIAYHLRPP